MEKIYDLIPFKDRLLVFLDSINVDYPPNNRFEQSFNEIKLAFTKEKNGVRDFSKEGHLRHAISELNELKFIIDNLPHVTTDKEIIKSKFIKILSGNTPIQNKYPENDNARNTIFELSLATYIGSKEVETYYEQGSDIVLKFNEKIFAIECKRINGTNIRNSLKNLLRDAHRQIIKRGQEIDLGIIAININNVYFDEGKLLITTEKELAKDEFNRKIKEFIHNFGHLWQRRNIISSSNLVPAVLICLNGTVYDVKNNFTGNAFFVVVNNTDNPTGKEWTDIQDFVNILK